jgi:hypothetical protein
MRAVGLLGLAVRYFSLSMAYSDGAVDDFVKARWRNIAYATRYGKGCSLLEAMSLDTRSMNEYGEAVSYCLEQESRATKRS